MTTPTQEHAHDHHHSEAGPHVHAASAHTHHHPPSSSSFASANAEHFDAHAHTYDNVPGAQELLRRVGAAVRGVFAFDEDATAVLDFACGTGLLSQELAPYAKTIVGVDISQGMVDYYNQRVANQGIPPEEMRAVRADLKGEAGELENAKFDVAVCSLAYHHLESPAATTRAIAHFLKPGGSLVVVDFMKNGGPSTIDEKHSHIAPHAHGFSEAEVREMMDGAGLHGLTFSRAFSARKSNTMALQRDVDFFVAKATKPSVA